MGWVVGGLYLLSMILTAAANLGGVGTVAVLFGHIGLGAFLTLLLLHLSGMLNNKSKAETTDTKTAGK
jgi:amino acid transporter